LRYAHSPLVVIASIATLFPAYAIKPAIPVVELGTATKSADGFHVALDAVTFPPLREPAAVPQIAFVAEVPLGVGKTRLSIVWLEIHGDRGQLLLNTLLDKRLRGKIVRCSVDVERRLASHCVLHFQYTPPEEPGRWVKDYVLTEVPPA
jgi:hypothetical protein